jgi:tRNA(fMet)-specific endonuclease VapC
MKYMLDTNICIYIIKSKPRRVFTRLKTLSFGDVVISAITYAELEYGVSKSSLPGKNRIALLKFTAPLEILPFFDKAAVTYGQLRALLEKTGQIIGPMDLLIGAHAVAEGLTLVTNNVSEFGRIPDLKIENWVESLPH